DFFLSSKSPFAKPFFTLFATKWFEDTAAAGSKSTDINDGIDWLVGFIFESIHDLTLTEH
ncbi:hypothetical protein BpHYR1_047707, partial [Brachionus plicatilis]